MTLKSPRYCYLYHRLSSWHRLELRSCVKVEVTVLGSPSLIIRTVSVDVKKIFNLNWALELMSCVKVDVFPVPNSPYGLCGRKATLNLNAELRNCVEVEVDVMGSPSLIIRTVSVDVKYHCRNNNAQCQRSFSYQLQPSGSNSLFMSVILLLTVLLNLLEKQINKPFLFSKTFSSALLPWYTTLSLCEITLA